MSTIGLQQRVGRCPSACVRWPGGSSLCATRHRSQSRSVNATALQAHRGLSCSHQSTLDRRCQAFSWHTITPVSIRGRPGRHWQRSPRQITVAAGKGKSSGPFSPIVVVVRNQIGTKKFNQLRGQAISLHSQVIKTFGKNIGAEQKQVQGLIRLAKANGEKLGFLS